MEYSIHDFTWSLRGGGGSSSSSSENSSRPDDYYYHKNEVDPRYSYSSSYDPRGPSPSSYSQNEEGQGGEDGYYPGEEENDGDDYYEYKRRSSRDYSPSSMDDRSYRNRKSSPSSSSLSSLLNISDLFQYGNKKVGMIFLAGGVIFTMLGISLFFNKGLMRLGNVLFLVGIPLTLGPGRTVGYFLQPRKARATGCLGLGIFLVLVGWPILGIALEIFGLLNLFGNMFPVLMVLLKQLPGLGSLLSEGNNKNMSDRQDTRRRGERRRESDYDSFYADDDADDYNRRDRYDKNGDRYEYGGEDRRRRSDYYEYDNRMDGDNNR